MEPSQQATPGYNQTPPQSQPYPQGQPTATYPAGGYPSNQPGYQQPPPIVVVAQPVATTNFLAVPRPPDYMIPSILVCVFCFWPTGLTAIYYSSRTNAMVRDGNMAEAERYSKTAKYLLITTVVCGVIWIVIVIAVKVAAASAAASAYKY